jgi:colicin import membrane protein
MAQVIYHQESGDSILDLVEKTAKGATLINADGEVVVMNAKEGPGVGQYAPVYDPAAAAKALEEFEAAEAKAKADAEAAAKAKAESDKKTADESAKAKADADKKK